MIYMRFQKQQPTSGGTVRSSDLLIVVISSLQTVFSTFAAAKLTHYSTMPHRLSDSSRPRQRLLLSGDVHQNPDPATKYPCSVCTSNVTSRGVSYMCNRCSGWVHSKCSGLQRSTVKLRTGHASLAVPHPLHKYRNRFHHQLQPKLLMGIPSPFCNSTQMASATNMLK